VGTLSCRVDPNIGFIIIGHQPTQCVYSQAPGAVPQVPPQSYDGALSTIGVALGVSTGSVLGWAGLSSRRQPACRPEHLPANMSAFRPMSVSAWALERTCSRLEPNDCAAAVIASGIHGDQRDRRRIVTQAPLALDG
jgi:hypothetical protein